MVGKDIHFSIGSEEIQAYVSVPKSGVGPGIVVLQEWWGLVPHIKDVADRFAEAGFIALAPDLYHGKSTVEPDEAASLMQALHIAETESILRKAILELLGNHGTSPNDKVGVVGFCMGGQLALCAAANNPVVGAAVDFYGVHPDVQPSYRDINCPILGFFAENDHNVTGKVVEALDQELTILGKPHHFETYPGTDHAFFNDTRPEVYNEAAAHDAWEKMIVFFRETLLPA
jgi:carboxymethylenebutenolidase